MKKFYFLSLLLCLTACTMPGNFGPDLETTSASFCEAMRWRDFLGAANFLEPSVRETFLQQFQNENLFVVESRIIEVQVAASAESATADYLLEYYLLPSNQIKKWHWQQQWQLSEKKSTTARVWRIENAPPAFP
jgi:hypothetical protein